MKKKVLNLGLCILLFGASSHISHGQLRQVKKANKQFENYAYSDAIQSYMRIVDRGKATIETYAKLGDAFYFNAKLIEANKWYNELFSISNNSKIEGHYYFRYAQTLKAVGQQDKAEEILKYWVNNFASEQERKYYIVSASIKDGNYIKKGALKLELASFNSDYSDYGAIAVNDKIVFASSRPMYDESKVIDKWTNESYISLFEATNSSEKDIIPIALGHTDKRINESSVAFSKDASTMFFTTNNVNIKRKKRYNKKGSSLLKIFKATKLENGAWGSIEELSINSDDFNTAHPSLSPDEKYLYFSSDRPGGYGESDLYKVELHNLMPVNQPINLGENINTSGRETFPFISKEALYFSSDSRIGYGGLDIFKVDILSNDMMSEVKNLGKQFNSSFDDFAYFSTSQNTGFISSNRPNKEYKSDNIYSFTLCSTEFFGKVIGEEKLEGIGESVLRFRLIKEDEVFELLTDETGSFYTEDLRCNQEYSIAVESKGYESKTLLINLGEESPQKEQDIFLKEISNTIWKDSVIEPIYFNFDKAFIRKESIATLNKILNVLATYQGVKIEIRSHTDSRGSKAYNLTLSEKRARETVKWLIDNGGDKERITFKGMGESELLNNCDDKTPCSSEKHAINRRSDFKIIKQ